VIRNIHFQITGFLFWAHWALGSGSNAYGLPAYLDMATFTINDYVDTTPDLGRSHVEGDRFFSQLHSQLASKYPSIISNRNLNERDASVTKAKYIAANTNGSEFVFFCGHGNKPGIISQDGKYVYPGDKGYGGWTRWPFLIPCLVLNNSNPDFYAPMFKGAHAIFGYASTSVEYNKRYNCNIFNAGCLYYRSEDAWNYFTDNWVNRGMFMYDAYVEAVRNTIYAQGGAGVSPAAIYCYGNVNGRLFIGGTEMISTIFNGEVPYASLNKVYRFEKFGTPTY
jgi:hypothetical protein